MENEVKGFLGRGWKFPIRVDKKTGRIKTSEYEEDIKEAIYIILMTRKGERVMMPDFGCDIQKYLFDTNDYTTLKLMETEVKNALVQWEPRISEILVELTKDDGDAHKLLINISYVVRATNNPYNLVYPFYINEGIG
ncbi:GPW/gp25 family protein [Herbivorax sp. ANBcel31]|uniref:GPW/gp25 family protein n=1 Tax=Herbivorax sp. ANBcel31 TaxID=3069754 RepID=UPI0027B5F2A6|nr:GPW/gp25 family protein [Herbivorax sp. ANBcel31]MDQ2085376.1 GPW/gp25 family protein [Herbivorax sp. ANBcel31]